MVHKVNEALAEHETTTGAVRLIPGELLVELEGERLPTAAFPRWSQRLADGCKVAAYAATWSSNYRPAWRLIRAHPGASVALTDQKELVGRRGGKEFLPAEPLDVKPWGKPQTAGRSLAGSPEPVIDHLAQDYGCKPALAQTMAEPGRPD